MTASPIQAAFGPFADALRAGGFQPPAVGWNASQIAAHVVAGNELFSELAERLHGGAEVSFDNSPVVNGDDLQAYADKLGGLAALADGVASSAARLQAAHDQLTEEERGRLIPVVIWSDGHLVTDEPASLDDLITGQSTGHLGMHLAQLEALRPAAAR
jgi:hypothetical protein